ncbi:hypothetical protein DY000_02057252 [Brassica cretica]|uniref:Uncharacterized protein n=1 Tax=Brassica cretica TaxID=69181 RepID=A0ABQ7AAX9_BRACR|nr:hypothetical protein DY000_02057252 [Brassica cretica]
MDANGDLMRESGRSGANHMNAWINVSERVTEAVSQRVLGFGQIRRDTATGPVISSVELKQILNNLASMRNHL